MIFISEKAPENIIGAFKNPILVRENPKLSGSIASHPDMHMCLFPDGEIIYAREDELYGEYPENIGFNAVCIDRYFIHNLKYTNKRVLKKAKEMGLSFVNVRQGYTKCSCVVVDGQSVITADRGIAAELEKLPDVKILTVSQGNVELSGYDYGFLGGASGTVDGTLWFAGDITLHPDFDKIAGFIRDREVDFRWIPGTPLTDVGSIIEGQIIK